MISKREEMVLDTKENFPSKRPIFRWALRFPFLVSLGFFRKLIYRFLPNAKASPVTPGFTCVLGNIYCENVYLNDTVFLDYAPIYIGEGTQFSGKNTVITSTHSLQDFSKVIAKPVLIGKNVWITHQCIILGGVSIGDNSVIGAGSVVSRDIPPNVFAAGNPCRVIKTIDRGSL